MKYYLKCLHVSGHNATVEAYHMTEAVKKLQAMRKLGGVITHPLPKKHKNEPQSWEIESEYTHEIFATISEVE